MKFKRILSVVLSAALITSTTSLSVFARGGEKKYDYVALGDSIAAGFGLSGDGSASSLAVDPALILSEDLIANPVRNAYAAVFGRYLAEIGENYGYTTTATNLSSTAYRAVDVEQTILNEGYKGEVAEWILEKFVGEGGSAPLEKYHEIYSKYLPEAELVSIQLGGNDIVMNILYPILKMDNPVLMSMSLSLMLTLFGCDTATALGGGLQYMMQNKDGLTYEKITEAAEYFKNVGSNGEYYVNIAAEQVADVVDAVKQVNNTADIVLVGMFNPYGNSLVYEGQVRDMANIVKDIFAQAAEIVCGQAINTDEIVIIDDDFSDETENFNDNVSALSKFSAKIKNFTGSAKAKFTKLVSAVANEISYPLLYMTAGNNVEPQMTLLNEKLKVLADETGSTYVDVYDISNECNLDPHPTASGHKEIADIMKTKLSGMINERMSENAVPAAEKVTLSQRNVTVAAGNTVQLNAEVAPFNASQIVKWKTSNNKVATVDSKGTVTALKEGKALIYAVAENGKTAVCVVTVEKKSSVLQTLFKKLLKK